MGMVNNKEKSIHRKLNSHMFGTAYLLVSFPIIPTRPKEKEAIQAKT